VAGGAVKISTSLAVWLVSEPGLLEAELEVGRLRGTGWRQGRCAGVGSASPSVRIGSGILLGVAVGFLAFAIVGSGLVRGWLVLSGLFPGRRVRGGLLLLRLGCLCDRISAVERIPAGAGGGLLADPAPDGVERLRVGLVAV